MNAKIPYAWTNYVMRIGQSWCTPYNGWMFTVVDFDHAVFDYTSSKSCGKVISVKLRQST